MPEPIPQIEYALPSTPSAPKAYDWRKAIAAYCCFAVSWVCWFVFGVATFDDPAEDLILHALAMVAIPGSFCGWVLSATATDVFVRWVPRTAVMPIGR